MKKCDACKREGPPEEFAPVAGPGGTFNYCRDTGPCKLRQRSLYFTPKENPVMFETYEELTPEDITEYKPKHHYGNPCIVRVREIREGVETVNGPSDAVMVDLHDLKLGETFHNVLLFGGAFVDGFRRYIGKGPVVVYWKEAKSKAGRKYAVAAPATPEMIKYAERVYAKGDPFLSKIEEDKPAEDKPADPWAQSEVPF
jgi:hypothetical protein